LGAIAGCGTETTVLGGTGRADGVAGGVTCGRELMADLVAAGARGLACDASSGFLRKNENTTSG